MTVGGIDAHQAAGRRMAFAAGENENPAFSLYVGGNGRGVTGAPLVACPPGHLSGGQIKCRDARTVRRADIDDERSSLNQRTCSHPEEILRQLELLHQIAPPDELPRKQIYAM